MTVYWDAKVSRYRYSDTKRFVSRTAVNAIALRSLLSKKKELEDLTRQFTEGDKTFLSWQLETAQLIREIHIIQAGIGRGGLDRLSDKDWLIIARDLKQEYKYFRNFASEIKKGQLTTPQIQARASLYVSKAREARELMEQQNAIDNGYSEMKRFLGETDKHCSNCLSYANMGWVGIGELPLPTVDCQCRANCKCRVEYR